MRVFLLLTIALCAFACIAPYSTPNDPYRVQLENAKQPPNAQFPFGTDQLGRCVLSRIMAGAPATIYSSLIIVGATFLFGTLAGVLCGYFGGRLDSIIMRIVDVILAFPGIVLAIAVAGILGAGITNAVLALSFTNWTQYARLSRSQVLAMREDAFIQSARLSGSSDIRIIIRHILPHVVRVLIVTASLAIGGTILELAGLSFLGLGAQPPKAEWGVMMNEGRSLLQQAPWIILYPGLTILAVVMLFNLLGDSIRDVLDPNQKNDIRK